MSNFNNQQSGLQGSNLMANAGWRIGLEFFSVRLGHQLATLEIELPYLGLCIFYPEQELFYSLKHQTYLLPIIKNVQLSQLKKELITFLQQHEMTQQAA